MDFDPGVWTGAASEYEWRLLKKWFELFQLLDGSG
jgi:hypothetical protein